MLAQDATVSSAPKLVREANELLLKDQPAEALKTYEKARALRPDAREIAFDEALAHYRMGEFEKSREAFRRSAGGAADALADDALYGLGTCDHAEALTAQDPKEALSKIESAMRSYQSVLGNQPEHTTARDANLKAASYWRQLKQQLQQQQQQQQQQNQDKQNEDQQQQDQQQQQNEQQQEQSQQQQSQEQDQQQQQQQAHKEESSQEQQKEQEQQASAQKEERQQKEMSAEEKEEASREQAERKLREMVQAMRDRKKHRREETKTPTHSPTVKDW